MTKMMKVSLEFVYQFKVSIIIWSLLIHVFLMLESVKLFFKDCHQRQAALNTIHPSPNSPVSYFMGPLSKGEILYTSGQSRLQLYLREGGHIDSNDVLDFLIFKKRVASISKIPKFPLTLDEEAMAFRSHGFPLLVWPRYRDKATLQQVFFQLRFFNRLELFANFCVFFSVPWR